MARVLDPNRRGELLRAARSVFREEGVVGARVADIAQRAGVATGTVYRYFDSKEALVRGLVEDCVARLANAIVPKLQHPDAAVAVAAAVDAVLDFGAKERDLLRLARAHPGLAPPTSAPSLPARPEPQRRLAALLAAKMEQGQLRPYDPQVLAELLLALVQWVAERGLPRGEAELECYKDTLVRFLQHALLPSASQEAPAVPAPVPTLRGLPVLGSLPEYRSDRLDLFQRVVQEHGDVGAFKVGPRTIVLVNAPDLVQAVLVDHADDFEKTANLRAYGWPVLGNGLLTSENAFHKRQRKLVAPAFQHRRIAAYADVMADYAERLQATWAEGQELDVAHEMTRLTLWIVGRTLFDADVLGEAEELGAALTAAMQHMIAQFSALVHLPEPWPTPRQRRGRRGVERLDRTVYRMLAARRASGEDRGDLLSMLLQARDEDDGTFMTDRQVRDEAMTLFLAGHETTANALAWIWYLLTQHPDAYSELREEADRVLGGRTPTMADLPNLPFALQVLKEGLRLYPPAYMLGRQATKLVTLGQYELPAGSVVLISPYVLHRRADTFPAPENFRPERFAGDAEKRLPKGAYLPFGGGPRICIGNHFALLEGHLLLATLAQRVSFALVPNQQIETEPLITLRPRHGIKVVVRRRAEAARTSPAAHGRTTATDASAVLRPN